MARSDEHQHQEREKGEVLEALQDQSVFAESVQQYRRELQVHCYRMVGSLEDSEDLLQETLLRAWRKLDSFEGRSSFRAWLYRIATNACLDFLKGPDRRAEQLLSSHQREYPGNPLADLPWLQPYPDQLLDTAASSHTGEPEAALIEKETIELVFLIALQHLPQRQRAVFILRDVLGYSTNESAEILGMTNASLKSALQRARSAMRRHLPVRRNDWTASADAEDLEGSMLRSFIDAHEQGDVEAIAKLLSEGVRLMMPPHSMWFQGRASVLSFTEEVFDPGSDHYHGEWKGLPVRANRQPAMAGYIRRPGEHQYCAQVLAVIRLEQGEITELTSFEPHLFPRFGLPMTLDG